VLVIAGIAGLMIGSFLNVCISRWQELETIVATRSHCPKCKKEIAWYDLVPLLSFALLKGNCRYCKEKISWQYPLIELLTAFVALATVAKLGLNETSLLLFALFSLLIVISVIDIQSMVIPDEYSLPAVLLAFVTAFFIADQTMFSAALGALVAGGFIASLVILSKEKWMGMGDISLAVILGLIGGLAGSVVGLVVAFFAGTLVGLVMLLLRRKGMKDSLPFGPFLALGSFVAALWGSELATWYLAILRW
jgi:leader peptidase (prepilin peptidase) / N-methyltransferase